MHEKQLFLSELTGKQISSKLKDDGWVIVDSRRSEIFSGWSIGGDKYGGHIIGATDFSENWLKFLNEKNESYIDYLLKIKGITANKSIVLYDYNRTDANKVAEFLKNKGINTLYYFNISNWPEKLKSYKNYKKLVPAEWLYKHFHQKKESLKIFEVSWKEPSDDFINHHIPGSIHIDSDEFEDSSTWTKKTNEELNKFLISNAINNDSEIVLYGMSHKSSAEYKLAVLLNYLGIEKVRVLAGGFESWEMLDYPIETGLNQKKPKKFEVEKLKKIEDYIISINEAKKRLSNPDSYQLVDVRGWKNYIGKESGYEYLDKCGRIPDSIWAGETKVSNLDGTMRNFQEVINSWTKFGIDINKKPSFFCGSAAWGASRNKFFCDIVGYTETSIFEGGWFEWQLDQKNPYEIGVPKGFSKDGELIGL